jgi:uncharacterized repeat protein (TIGR01451 family)
MKQPPQWLLKWGLGIILLTTWALGTLPLAQAQTAPPLALSKAVAAPAVVGDTLTYILTITNTGHSPLSGVRVADNTPDGTTLFGLSGPSGWLMTSPGQGQVGQVAWQAENALAPGEVATLQFMVKVELGAAGQIINDGYAARAEGWPEPVRGPTVITSLRAPTPTLIPPPTHTPQPTTTPTFTPSPALSQVEGSQVEGPTLTPVPAASLIAEATPTVVVTPRPTSPAAEAIIPNGGVESDSRVLVLIGLAVLVVLSLIFVVIKWRR